MIDPKTAMEKTQEESDLKPTPHPTSDHKVPDRDPPRESRHSRERSPVREELSGRGRSRSPVRTEEPMTMEEMMGFGGFGTTKNKHVQGTKSGAVKVNKRSEYRQYMNRDKGFNRALSPTRGEKKKMGNKKSKE
ncbi:hypothetical protein BABINDRAFT_161939 [Babjeviella inositovora NRRL Y-12698]|uniref:U4/U6.U5 small nuclear ribonucleoprotein 27kDa protein domain-containing protein n=1 Tax=Babjeviella inositovora NRRL Y-12698 TaxID=984486 RepID=A0A1E3QPC7_9ASCO|nr:uncharacterized protein BABINDRAFT_161939 [Babjeviella inositovora NRRL Y-12698]ODQ79553.1 hypothetical protein BABINDRAFT_161939 [Babjeviella inositovora NRRL Y-12698]